MNTRARRLRSGGAAADLIGVGVAFVVAVVLPLWLAHRGGVLDLPRSDDWSYLRALFGWSEHGHLDFNEWVSMTLIGQLALARPVVAVVGQDVAAMHWFGAFIGFAGIIAAARLGVAAGLERSAAWLLAVSVAASPLWSTLAPTFMTDVPAFAFQTMALAAAVRAFSGRRATAWFAIAVACAVFAVAIRQYAVVTLAAILFTALVLARQGRPVVPKRVFVVCSGAATVAILGLLAWWFGIPDRLSLAPQVPSGYSFRLAFTAAGGFLRLCGLLLLPAVLLARPDRVVRRAFSASRVAARAAVVMAAALLGATYALDVEQPFVGNYVDRRGALSDDIVEGVRPYVVPRWWFEVLVVLASAAALVLVLAAIPAVVRWRAERRQPGGRALNRVAGDPVALLFGSMLAAMFASYELALLVQFPMFDRYVLPGLVPIGILLVRAPAGAAVPESGPVGSGPVGSGPVGSGPDESTRTRSVLWRSPAGAAALGAVAMLGALGAIYAQESAAFDAARWEAAERAVAAGFEARDVYAGYEWRGWTTGKAPGFRPSIAERKRLRRRYLEGVCVEAKVRPTGRIGPAEGVVVKVPTDGWLRSRAWIVARVVDRPCASGASTAEFRERP